MSVDRLPSFLERPNGSQDTWVTPNKKTVPNLYGLNIGGSSYVDLIFFPRNTLPLLGDGHDKQFIFTSDGPWITSRAHGKFERDLNEKSILNPEAPEKFDRENLTQSALYIESYPLSLVAAASLLDPENYALRNLRAAFDNPVKPRDYDHFLDLVIAGKFFSKDGALKEKPDFEGEVLMIAALIGDRSSASELVRRKHLMNGEQIKYTLHSPDAKSNKGTSLKDLVAVHATEYLPSSDEKGAFINSKFDGSGEDGTRLSVHFALNHHVVSHSQGQWTHRPFVVISPYLDLVDLNGQPTSLRPEDTFFTLSPGTPLRLPSSSVLVRPDDISTEKALPIDTVYYGSSFISQEELLTMDNYWSKLYRSPSRNRELFRSGARISWEKFALAEEYGSIKELVQGRLEAASSSTKRSNDKNKKLSPSLVQMALKFWEKLYEGSFRFGDDPIAQLILDEKGSHFSDQALTDFDEIQADLRSVLAPVNKVITTETVIKQMGYQLKHVDPYYVSAEDLGDTDFPKQDVVIDILDLADKTGVSKRRHPKTQEGDLDQLLNVISRNVKGGWSTTPYEQRQFLQEYQTKVVAAFPALSEAYRRMIYLTGSFQIADYITY